ncbi:hypothetical protein Aduo_006671 [Ancylostoma duodenale]
MFHGRLPSKGKSINSPSSAKKPSTRRSSARMTTTTTQLVLHNIPEYDDTQLLNGEQNQRPEESASSVVIVAVILLVIIAVIFLAYMMYMCRMKVRKRRILEETRKKISEVVITAGSVCSSKATTTSKTSSTRGRHKTHSVDESELKTFKCKGPLVMQARLRGEVKHALDNSLSKSLHEPLRYDPEHNEIVLIGTDVDRIVGEGPQQKTKTGTSFTSGSRECVTQSDPQFSKESAQRPTLKKGLSAEKEDRLHRGTDIFALNLKTQTSGSGETPQPSFDSGGSSSAISSPANERGRTSPESRPLATSTEKREEHFNRKAPHKKKRVMMTATPGRKQKERKLPVSKQKARTDPSETKAAVVKLGGVNVTKQEKVFCETCRDSSHTAPKKTKKKKILTKIASVHATQDDGDEKAATPVKRLPKQSLW